MPLTSTRDIFIHRFLVLFRCFMVFAIFSTAVYCLVTKVGPPEFFAAMIGHVNGYVFASRMKFTKKKDDENLFDLDEVDNRRLSIRKTFPKFTGSLKTI